MPNPIIIIMNTTSVSAVFTYFAKNIKEGASSHLSKDGGNFRR